MITLETLLKQREHLLKRAEDGLALHHQAKGALVLVETQIRQLQDEAKQELSAPAAEPPLANGSADPPLAVQ